MQCPICNSFNVNKIKDGVAPSELTPEDFAITDKRYGITLDVFLCKDCDFQFCPTAKDLLNHYESMIDEEYTGSDPERVLQFREIYKRLKPHLSENHINSLDIGCGSGLLVEIFHNNGFNAFGIEPSKVLAEHCKSKKLNVTSCTVQDLPSDVKYDIITLVDVIEHVENPKSLIDETTCRLKENGILCVVTPRVDSIPRRILGFKWWHYRIAHVGYFTKANLSKLLTHSGISIICHFSPSWFFSFENLIDRIIQYLPFIKLLKFQFVAKYTVRINLHDSIAVIGRKK